MNNLNFNISLGVIVIIHVLLALLFANNQLVEAEQWNLIANSLKLNLHNQITYTGEILPGVGPTIGFIPSMLVSLSLFIYDNLFSPMLAIIVIRLFSFFILIFSLKYYFSKSTLILFSILLLLSPWFLYDTMLSQDSLVIFGVAITFSSLLTLRKFTKVTDEYGNNIKIIKGNFLRDFIFTIFVGFGVFIAVQANYISFALIFLIFFLLLRGIIKISITGWLFNIVVFGGIYAFMVNKALSDPETLEVFFNSEEAQIGYGATYVYPTLKTIVDWVRLGSTFFSHYVIKDFNPAIFTQPPISTFLYYVWLVVMYLIGSLTFIFNLLAILKSFKDEIKNIFTRHTIYEKKSFLILISFYSFISILIISLIMPISITPILLEGFIPFAILPLLLIFEKINEKVINHNFVALLVAIFMVISSVCVATSSGDFSDFQTFEEQLESDNSNSDSSN